MDLSDLNHVKLPVQGIHCNCSVSELESGVTELPGVVSCSYNLGTGNLEVRGAVERELLLERIRALGFSVRVDGAWDGQPQETEARPGFAAYLWRSLDTRLALLGALLVLPGVVLGEVLGLRHGLLTVSSLGALVTAGYPIARSALRSLRHQRQITINALMTIASMGAVLIGAVTEAGMVMVLFALGEALEGYTAARARGAIRALMQVVPRKAHVLRKHGESFHEVQVDVEALEVGDVIHVKPGEHIPMDGRVLAGYTSVNQAPITGEGRLVAKEPGDDVFASSINGEGALEIEVTHRAADNTISRLVKMVEEAQERRAPVQRFVDTFARTYTPAVVAIAFLVASVPPLLLGLPFLNSPGGEHGWLYRGLALLVVACPCALVISTPVSIISAISNAARHGVLVKGGAYLERLSSVRAIALDKTGTLTQGTPTVFSAHAQGCAADSLPVTNGRGGSHCEHCDDMIALASAIEMRSEHALAHAIVRESHRRDVYGRYPAGEGVRALPGNGVRGRVDGREVILGSHAYFDETIPHDKALCAQAAQYDAQGMTPIMVAVNGHYLGMLAIADTLRDSSRAAIELLRDQGLSDVVMLTGDTTRVSQDIADQVGLVDVQSDLLPQDKVAAVHALQAKHGPVAMVGDGINDAPALATADVGIAIGGSAGGTAQAMETADITIMGEDLRRLPFILRLSRASMATIRFNVALSLGVKLAFLILVLFGYGTMWMAVLADMGTSLIVTLNGMRLLTRPRMPAPTS